MIWCQYFKNEHSVHKMLLYCSVHHQSQGKEVLFHLYELKYSEIVRQKIIHKPLYFTNTDMWWTRGLLKLNAAKSFSTTVKTGMQYCIEKSLKNENQK